MHLNGQIITYVGPADFDGASFAEDSFDRVEACHHALIFGGAKGDVNSSKM